MLNRIPFNIHSFAMTLVFIHLLAFLGIPFRLLLRTTRMRQEENGDLKFEAMKVIGTSWSSFLLCHKTQTSSSKLKAHYGNVLYFLTTQSFKSVLWILRFLCMSP